MTDRPHSSSLFERAKAHLIGGVNSPVRAFGAVGGTPVFIERGQGAYLYDSDGRRYVDFVLSYGPLILGHAHPEVVEALRRTAGHGTSFGAPTEGEIELAETIHQMMPAMEKIRFVNSGTEATMSALRLARAFTSRNKIIKFKGCYHGHADLLLVQAGSGVTTLGLPDSPGVPAATVGDTLVAPFNDLPAVGKLFEAFPREIAAVIVEPVAGNMGVIPPADGFLRGLRDLTESQGALLIFDEVMTGFRVHPGGAQELYGIEPDLTTLGKVIGGGLPVGAYGGRSEIMAMLAPEGPVYQAGTLSGNPLAMQAGLTTLRILDRSGLWQSIDRNAGKLAQELRSLAAENGIKVSTPRVGTMLSLFFCPQSPTDWDTAQTADTDRFAEFYHLMLEGGVYLAPSQFEAAFLSSAHDDRSLDQTLSAARQAFSQLS